MNNSFECISWKSTVEIFVYQWRMAIEVLRDVNLEKFKSRIKDNNNLFANAIPEEYTSLSFEIITNPIEQIVSEGLILGLYGSFEKTLMELVEIVETSTKESFRNYCKNKKNKYNPKIVNIKSYLEIYSNIKFDNCLFEDVKILNRIRNRIIHNGGMLEKKDFYLKNQISKFAIIDDSLYGEVYLGEDLDHLFRASNIIKDFLMYTVGQEIFK